MSRTIAALLITAGASFALASCGGFGGPGGHEIPNAQTANQIFSVVRGTTELLADYLEPDAEGRQVLQGEEGTVELYAECGDSGRACTDQDYDRHDLRLTAVFKDYRTSLFSEEGRWTVLNGTVEYEYRYSAEQDGDDGDEDKSFEEGASDGRSTATQIIELSGTGVYVVQGEARSDSGQVTEEVLIEDIIDLEAHNVDSSSWRFSGSITTSSGEVYEIE